MLLESAKVAVTSDIACTTGLHWWTRQSSSDSKDRWGPTVHVARADRPQLGTAAAACMVGCVARTPPRQLKPVLHVYQQGVVLQGNCNLQQGMPRCRGDALMANL
jgi:hypothetical protein